MPIGDYYKYLSKNKMGFFVTGLFGTLDLHSHIRLRPVMKFMRNYMKDNLDYNIMEIGCGNGINAFEISRFKDRFNYIGFDLNKDAIDSANSLAKKLNLEFKMNFVCADATKYNFETDNNKFDIILLIDFLEHIENPLDIIKVLKPKLQDGAVLIISVPTYNYPRVFGKVFHKNVGHIRNGFTLKEIADLFKHIEAEIVHYSYNTGLLSGFGCAIYYRIHATNKYLNAMKGILLYPFIFLDYFNNCSESSSLFVVFKI